MKRHCLLAAALIAALSAPAGAQIIASYDAGTAGNPPIAPTPVSQGWTRVDTSGGSITETDVSPDGSTGLNAWNIDDQTSGLGGLVYKTLFTQQQMDAAFTMGWWMSTDMRMIHGATQAVVLHYSTGLLPSDDLYQLYFAVSGNDVIVNASGTGYITCPNGFDGNYHEFAVRKWPLESDAELLYDGVVLGVVGRIPSTSNASPGGMAFGTLAAAGSGSANWNVVGFEIMPPLGTPYCFGDGSGGFCPCGNLGASDAGCANSSGSGSVLAASGTASVSLDDLVLDVSGLLPGQPALLFVGLNAVNNGNGVPFGDGLRCAGGSVVRLGVRIPDANGDASWGPGLQPQGGWQSGDTRRLQCWYRDPGGPCGAGFNLSNGFEISFLP